MKKLYIAYGSNMDEEQMAFRCPTATLVGTAIVEGYPNFYYKKMLEVQIKGKIKSAMVYIMDEQRKIGVPSAGYYRTLEQAYEKFGFEEDVLKQALKNSIEEVQHGISE